MAELGLEQRLKRLQDDFDTSFARDVEEERLDLALHLTVQVGDERFALPVQHVSRLVCDADVVPLPGAPAHLMGIMNLRGEMVAIYDLPSLFGYGHSAEGQRNVVVLKGLGFDAGLAVSDLGRLVSLDAEQMGPAPGTVPDTLRQVIRGTTYHDGKLLLFPDLKQLCRQLDARN